MSRKNIILVVLVVVLGAMGVGYYALSGTGGGGASDDGRAGYTLVATDRGMGNPKAPVTVIEYGAPSCSICAYFTANIFPDLKKNYIDTGKVYYVFRVFPLRPEDGDVEKMARCLPEDKYFPFLDLFWRNQPKWDAAEYPGITDPHGEMIKLGRIAGLSSEQMQQCIDNKAEDARINKVAAEAEDRYHINATPTFIIDGMLQPSGALPYEQLSKIIDAELAKKK